MIGYWFRFVFSLKKQYGYAWTIYIHKCMHLTQVRNMKLFEKPFKHRDPKSLHLLNARLRQNSLTFHCSLSVTVKLNLNLSVSSISLNIFVHSLNEASFYWRSELSFCLSLTAWVLRSSHKTKQRRKKTENTSEIREGQHKCESDGICYPGIFFSLYFLLYSAVRFLWNLICVLAPWPHIKLALSNSYTHT